MNHLRFARPFAAALACAAMSACSTVNFDTNTTTEAQFDTVFATNNALTPAAVPIFGSATYEGEIQIDTISGTTQSGSIRGGLIMEASFSSTDPITATAGGFAGTVNGQRVTYSGQLSSDDAPGLLPLNQVLTSGFGPTAASTMFVSIGGTLRNDDTGVRNRLQAGFGTAQGSWLQGDFRGSNARVVTGEAQFNINPSGGVSAITGTANDAIVTGQFYGVAN
ncbi:MAG: hypothetical protein HOY44_06705 [Maritimibacter sp.]|uniref:hypothetical protein n=1 Tax=Maritimibacter sp. TaxID=2003363 RepID=UPI001D3FEA3A|nr:hypothetical protein [Maritimibacter sp.]MBL6427201.1 hypothetical protein [Maritimibacter sp.]